MAQATYEQVNLMLKLYDMRREPRLREARSWFSEHFQASSVEEMMQKYPPWSEENLNVRMTVSYWDMVASIANRGLMDDDLFFENTGEAWAVWERIKVLTPGWRRRSRTHTFSPTWRSCPSDSRPGGRSARRVLRRPCGN